ncbi:transmembrane protein 186 [Anopheles nili]|uniref:transmembrane protein 186 n=1 Tax=Anopheles nili TaxID=185578 RepID=UPI00237BC0C3|nr:transmembrane protein 186 [Anopheles nili]
MLQSCRIFRCFSKTNVSVISSLTRHQPIVYQRSIRTPIFGSLVQNCSTKSALINTDNKKSTDNDANDTNWNTIYHLPSILLTASLKRLKFYPVICTGITVPVAMGLAYLNIWSMATAEICGAIGLTTAMTLSIFGLFTNNLIGFVYCDDQLTKVKISFLDAKGKRQDRIYSVDDLVSRTELPQSFLKIYFPVKNHENGDVYKLVHRYGEIYDVHAFNKVFGHDVVTRS